MIYTADQMDFSTYRAIDAVNASKLNAFAVSPAHALVDTPPTRAQILGIHLHTAILEPGRFATEAPKLTDLERSSLDGMRCAVETHKIARWYLDGERELSIVAFDLEYEESVKCRIDVVHDGIIVDIKTAACADPRRFPRDAFSYGYHRQMAWYRRIYAMETGKTLGAAIIAVEKKPPHGVVVYRLSEETLQRGHDEVMDLYQRYLGCQQSGGWPCYSDDEEIVL